MYPQVNPYSLYGMMDEETFRPVYYDLLQQGVKYIYHNAIENIGMFKLIPLKYRTDHIAYLGGLAVDPRFLSRGEGQKMLKRIISFVGEQGFLRIELSVADSNDKAINLHKKNGFEKEGVLRKYSHLKSEGRLMDELMMSYIF